MLRDAVLVAGKDLRIEIRSRVGLNQIGPFAIAVLLLFGLALGPDRRVLAPASAGLFWVAVLLSTLLAVQRSYAIESADAARDGLRLSGLDPAGIFLGKASAVAAQLLVLEAGKPWIEADADTAEAIDFLEYYAREALKFDTPPPLVPKCTIWTPLPNGFARRAFAARWWCVRDWPPTRYSPSCANGRLTAS